MRCNVFKLSFGQNKKRKPVIEANCRLNINIEDHIAYFFAYFDTLKTCVLFYLGSDYIIPACRDEISTRPAETDLTLRLV